jgi:hypothetical protein
MFNFFKNQYIAGIFEHSKKKLDILFFFMIVFDLPVSR